MATPDNEFGYLDGEQCRRHGCDGVIVRASGEGCSCHISPPCGDCTEPREHCQKCDWDARDEAIQFNDHIITVSAKGLWKASVLRELDKTKIDWHSFSHTTASMIKRGVYPDGVTVAEVKSKVDGTFGGRFNYFRDGVFEYIAYTD